MEMRNKVHTLFGEEAQRVTTAQMYRVFSELERLTGIGVFIMQFTRSLPSKETHGDIDIVYIPMQNVKLKDALVELFDKQIVKTSSNGDVYSVLFDSSYIGMKVHVDFIKASHETLLTKLQYFSYNDFSGIIGIFSKKLNFKYGSEGFFKRYQDKRGNWHDILISRDLMVGLKILGFDPVKFDTIQTVDDIVGFMLSSNLMDSKYFTHSEMNQSDRKSVKRPVIEYVVQKLREANKKVTITNEDYYWVNLFRDNCIEATKQMIRINDSVAVKSKYNGGWIMQTFKLKPGPVIGQILKYLSDLHGNNLDLQDELEVMRLVGKYLLMNPQKKEG